MKHLKTYEQNYNLKKYILTQTGNDDKLDIFEIGKKTNTPLVTVKVTKLYTVREGKIRKIIKHSEALKWMEIRLSFIEKHLVEQSDNIDELLNKTDLIMQMNKFNI